VEARGLEPVTGTDVRLAGSVVGIGGRAFLARPVAQSFALAEVPGVAGVRIYHNSQLVGRTDGEGQLLVPALGGYGVNQLSLDDRDVPIDRELKQVRQEVVPRDFVGTRASFETKRVSALGGILVASIGGQPLPVASAELVLRGGKGDAAGISGPDGDFYFDDLEPGRYEIEALNRKVRCRASVTLAEGRGPFVDLGRVSCSAIAQ
jgi:outer membrane usher protein